MSVNQGSVSFSDRQPATPPGPPFPANSAVNGTSINGSGQIVLGNDLGGFAAVLLNAREIPMNGNLFQFIDGVERQFKIDPLATLYQLGEIDSAAGLYFEIDNTGTLAANIKNNVGSIFEAYLPDIRLTLGDVDNVANRTKLTIDDDSQRIIGDVGTFFRIRDTPAGNQWLNVEPGNQVNLGDINASGNNVRLDIICGTGNQLLFSDALGEYFDIQPTSAGFNYTLGDKNNVFNGNRFQIDDSADLAIITKGGFGRGLSIDFLNSLYQIGDIDGAGNGSKFRIIDGSSQFDISTTTGVLLNINQNTGLYQIGDISSVANRNFLEIDDTNQKTTIQKAGFGRGFLVDFDNNDYRLGDMDAALNGTRLQVDDDNERVRMITSADGKFFDFDPPQYRYGDIDGLGNGNFVRLSDAANEFELNNTANNIGILINGVAGFTGTVAAPATITVNSGIVTNVA